VIGEGGYMLRNFRFSLLTVFFCLWGVFMAGAQTDGNVTWRMAFLKGDIVNPAAQDLTKPIDMKSGGKFQLFVHVVESQAYVYVLFAGLDGTVAVLEKEAFPENTAMILPSQYETFTVTPPSGTEKIYVVVTATRQVTLEKLLAKSQKDAEAILDEVKRIQQSESTVTEVPQKPVPIGGVARGGMESLQATQFEGKKTYVQILRLVH
jgi:hypothetical protein